MKKRNVKRLTLALLLAALLLSMTGCFVKPDKTIDTEPTNPVVLPFATSTPSPSPAPTEPGQSGWEGGAGTVTGAPVATPTAPPVTAPPIQVVTPTPSPRPAWTYSPTARPTATDDGTLRHGTTGQAVRLMQQKLKDLGYYTGSVDGTFGSGTETALRAFQTTNGLKADGVAGQQTLNKLYSNNALPKPTATYVYATSRPTPQSYTPSTPSTYRFLQLGSNGADVTRLQNRLKELGYFNGTVSGSFGADTEAAVTAFQQRNGLWVDGVAGEDTQRMLFSSAALPYGGQIPTNAGAGYRTLKKGLSGDDVSALQTRLKELYYYNGSIDGKYGDSTELAVKVFQQRNGLTVDGVAGSGTLAKLNSSEALSAPTVPSSSPTPYRAGGTLQTGSMGDEVYRLQERLYDLGYYYGTIDGIYSDAVAMAVRAFQSANNLTADGKAGANTQTKLYSQSAVRASTGVDDSFSTLREGDTGERVRALQTLLSTYGYYAGAVDGKYGASTTLAVQQLQAQNSLSADGIAGPATLQLLYQGSPKHASTPGTGVQQPAFATLKQGASGPDVMRMQEFLQEIGYYTGSVDGNFSAATFIAVQAFQSRNGLKVDGIAGSETLALLYSGDGVPAAGFNPGTATNPERTSMVYGDEGQDVYDLQSRLKTLGYLTGTPDGKFGNATTVAVKAFQTKNGLKVDGAAGPETRAKLYAADVIPASASGTAAQNLSAVTNRARELEEQKASGAIQASLSGGGIAASLNSNVYFAGGANGTLYVSNGGVDREVYGSPASFIHASDKGITFVSGSKVLRVSASGGNVQTLIEAGGISKLSLVGDTLYYLEGNSLVKSGSGTAPFVLAGGVNDFTIDIYQYVAYIASPEGVKIVPLNGGAETLLVSTSANQVQLCDSVVFFRSGGGIYRVQNGVSVLLADAGASWMGIYRDKIYYISGDRLYRCDTNGQNNQVFYDGQTADVSFVAGNVYLTRTSGGPVTEILPVE